MIPLPQFLLRTAALALAASAVAASPGAASAAEVVRPSVLGANVEDSIAAGDVHAFLVPFAAGTRLELELRRRSADKGGGGPAPGLVVLDPTLNPFASATADGGVKKTATVSGTYRLEVRAGAYSGGYELKIDGGAPEHSPVGSESTVTLSGAPQTVHVDVAGPASVEIEARRVSGGAPAIESVADALGRPLSFVVKNASRSRVRLEPIPLGVPGGVDVTVSAQGGAGTVRVRATVREYEDRPEGGDERSSRRIVVLVAPGTDPAQLAADLGYVLVEVEGSYAVLETPSGHEGSEDDDAHEAGQHAGVLAAEPNLFAVLPEGSQSNTAVVGSDLGRSDFDGQGAMSQIRADRAHAFSVGANVVVAVLDGGVDATHELLAGHVLSGWDFVDGDADASEQANGLDDDGDLLVDEGFGHGTFVAGLVVGAAPGAKILPVRVLDTDGRGTISAIAAGITWSVDHGADVVNISFGTLGGSTVLASAVRYALGKGVVVVAATGNDAMRRVVDFPAALPGVIAVSATTAAGGRAPFANSATATAVSAPGVALIGPYPDARWATWSGTSFAAALVSGGTCLVLDRHPDFLPARVLQFVRARAKPFPRGVSPADRRLLGAGLLDLVRLVR